MVMLAPQANGDIPIFDADAYCKENGDDSIEGKAGIVLWGISEGKIKVVAPYVIGRFGKENLHYTIGKGTVDPGESVWDAAKREFREETGIDVESLIKARDTYVNAKPKKREEGAPRLSADTKCTVKKPPKDKISLKGKVKKQRVFEAYTRSSRDNPKLQTMYALQVENIDQLAEQCKNADVEARDIDAEVVEKGGRNFADLIDVMRSLDVFIPDFKALKDWDEDLPDSFDELATLIAEEIEARGTPRFDGEKDLHNPEYFDYLFEHATMRERNKIKDMATLVKGHIGPRYPGLIGDDGEYKLDTKGLPLRYYQEAATVLPYDDYLSAMQESCRLAKEGGQGVIGSYYNTHLANTVVVDGKRDDNPTFQRISSQLEVLKSVYDEISHGVMHNCSTKLCKSVKAGKHPELDEALAEEHTPKHSEHGR